ncbi:Glycoside hydrolase family 79 protein [Mycena sanguinolenta]|uniref:Glycoside hydrolase family 79 protein n=1 Tax=Mycena sanguinolenta TaxID=230812 RepID=A0A8H6ZC81_9AGAR|nr:Glycoside hydrolase family 79 protein [Mycena sanguinolenta]
MGTFWFTLVLPLVSAVTVPIPLSAGSAQSVTGNLVSLSIEQDREAFVPTIRIGADSEDHTNYNPNVPFVQQLFPPPTTTVPYPEATSIVAGPGFYEGAQFLPSGTGVTWGVNFGGKREFDAILAAFASPAVKNAGITLDFLELGNEADLYNGNGLRASTYNVAQYTTQWIQFATNMSATANLANSDTKIWGAAFAGSSHTTTGFSPQGIFANGILNSVPGKFINTISQHHYSLWVVLRWGSEGLLQDLMTKSTIRSNLSSFTPDIEATQAQGLDYLPRGNEQLLVSRKHIYSDSPTALLKGYRELPASPTRRVRHSGPWIMRYLLPSSEFRECTSTMALATNITWFVPVANFFFQHSPKHQIQPVTLTRSTLDGSTLATPQLPHIQPQYYAAIIAAEAIGDSGDTQALEININNTRISGYAFYESGALKRAVFINSLAFTTGQTKQDEHASGSVVQWEWHADDVSGLTWGGQTYETSNARVSGTTTSETGTVSAGIDIPATQAILISFN